MIKIVDDPLRYSRSLNGSLHPERGIVMTPEVFSKVFSPERVRLLRFLGRKKVGSIYQLAQELNKPYEVVYRNIRYLEGVGLVLVKGDSIKIPSLRCHPIIDLLAS